MISRLRALFRSFFCAGAGFLRTVREERNFRIHMTAIFWIFLFAFTYEIPVWNWGVLIPVCIQVLSLELFNTALENAVDAADTNWSLFAKHAKDAAAAAVLISAVGAIAVAIVLFRDPEGWHRLWNKLNSVPGWICFCAAVLISCGFIFFVGKIKKISEPQNSAKEKED